MAAFRADAEARRQVLVVNHIAAGRTLDPQPFGYPALLAGRLDRLPDLLEPGHSVELNMGVPAACRRSGPWHVVARSLTHGADLALQVGERLFAPGQVELGGFDDQQRRRAVMKEEVVVGLVQFAQIAIRDAVGIRLLPRALTES